LTHTVVPSEPKGVIGPILTKTLQLLQYCGNA